MATNREDFVMDWQAEKGFLMFIEKISYSIFAGIIGSLFISLPWVLITGSAAVNAPWGLFLLGGAFFTPFTLMYIYMTKSSPPKGIE